MSTNKIKIERSREIIQEIGKTFTIKQLTDYHFRVEETIDLFPARQRFHNIKTDDRGDWPADLKSWLTSILRPEESPEVWTITSETLSPRERCQEIPLPKGSILMSIIDDINSIVLFYRFPTGQRETEVKNFYYLNTPEDFVIKNNSFLQTVLIGRRVIHIFGDIRTK